MTINELILERLIDIERLKAHLQSLSATVNDGLLAINTSEFNDQLNQLKLLEEIQEALSDISMILKAYCVETMNS